MCRTILLIFCIILCICIIRYYSMNLEGFLTYKKCKTRKINGILKNIFDKYNINKNDTNNDWDIYLPCGYNKVESELKTIISTNYNQKIFGISGCDSIVSKNKLWSLLQDKYGRVKASNLMPESFVLEDKTDMSHFESQFDTKKVYILKKNIQRKKGLKLSTNYYEIVNSYKNGYKVVQEFRNDAFTINKRVMNIRIYLLISCQNNKTNIYAHHNGKCLYTSKDVNSNPLDFKSRITDSYKLPKNFYNTHPLTLIQLRRYLVDNGYDANLLFIRINKMLRLVSKAIIDSLCKLDNIKKNYKFQLFGLDVIFNKKLVPYILEINKGPDMIPKDNDDKDLKTKIEVDMLHKLNIIKIDDPKYSNDFYTVLENK